MSEPIRVVVVGCGGTGGHLVRNLVPALEFQAPGSTVILIDGDSYEPSNAERQSFSQLGNKAQVLRLDVSARFPSTIVVAQAAWIVEEGQQRAIAKGEEGVAKLAPSQVLKDGDHVFTMVDNNAARKILFDAAREIDNIDVYHGGNGTVEDGEPMLASTYHYIRRDGKDVTLNPLDVHPEMDNPTEKNPGSMSCEERAKIQGGTQTIAANMAVATLLMARVSTYILGTEEQRIEAMNMVEIFMNLADSSMAPYDDWLIKSQSTKQSQPELVGAASSDK